MDEDLKIKKISEKRVSQMTKNISWIFGIIGFVILLSQAIPLLNSYVLGKIQMEKEELMKNPIPQSYKEYIEDEFAYYDPEKATLRISLRVQRTFNIKVFLHMTQTLKQVRKYL